MIASLHLLRIFFYACALNPMYLFAPYVAHSIGQQCIFQYIFQLRTSVCPFVSEVVRWRGKIARQCTKMNTCCPLVFEFVCACAARESWWCFFDVLDIVNKTLSDACTQVELMFSVSGRSWWEMSWDILSWVARRVENPRGGCFFDL